MIFGRLKTKIPTRRHHLLKACFHTDPAKAFDLATRWFDRFDLDDVTYPEHRLLVRLHARFPALEPVSTTAGRIAGLKRQLWVRGNMNLKTVKPALEMLGDFGIDWVLTGAAQWFIQPEVTAREAVDIVDIVLPEAARSTGLHLLAQNGWRIKYTAPDAAAGPVFTTLSKGAGTLKVHKAGPLFTYAPDALGHLWETRVLRSHELGRFYLPDAAATFCMTLGKAHPKYGHDDQWIFDIFNQSPDPISRIKTAPEPVKPVPGLIRQLRTGFYR